LISLGFTELVTIFGGIALAFVLYAITWRHAGDWRVPVEIWTGYVVNSMTVATLACFLWDVSYSVVMSAFNPSFDSAIPIGGNAPLVMFVFIYALGQTGLSLRRAVLSHVALVNEARQTAS
jgi:hypothetical protein